MPFQIGDIVIGNPLASNAYGVTVEGWFGIVIEQPLHSAYLDEEEGDLWVRQVTNLGYGCFEHDTRHEPFKVESHRFDLFDSVSSASTRWVRGDAFKSTAKRDPFKVGDIVIGNDKNTYGETKKGWLGRVVKSEYGGIIGPTIIVRACTTTGQFIGAEYETWSVKAEAFDLFTTHKLITPTSSPLRVGSFAKSSIT